MVIAIDFDGTCTTHDFPSIGKDIGAVPILKRLIEAGHKLILFTMRSDREELKDTGDPSIQDVSGKFLTHAINWFEINDIELYGVQSNPTQSNWTTSPKCYAELYIDDAALGTPLKRNPSLSNRPFVDWELIEEWLELNKIL